MRAIRHDMEVEVFNPRTEEGDKKGAKACEADSHLCSEENLYNCYEITLLWKTIDLSDQTLKETKNFSSQSGR